MTRSRRAIIVLAACLTLWIAFSPTGLAQGDDPCDLDRTNTMTVGLAGVIVGGVSQATESIPEACQGETFTLEGSNPGDDFDVCWDDGSGDESECHAEAGDEAGEIPQGATEASIIYWSGASGTYTLTAPAGDGDQGSEDPDPVTDDVTLFLKSQPSGIGHADLFLGNSTMSQEAPTGDVPSAWYSPWGVSGTNPNTPYDANWEWSPAGGYDYQNVNVDVTFWATAATDILLTPTWTLSLYDDGQEVATIEEVQADLAPIGEPVKVEATFTGVQAQGDALTLTIDPVLVDSGAAHAILYDSADFPSNIQIQAPDEEVGSLGLDAPMIGDTYVELDWKDVDGIDHYRVHQDGAPIAEPDESQLLVQSLDAGGSYTFNVTAISMNGDPVLASSDLPVDTKAESEIDEPVIEDVQFEAGTTATRIAWNTTTPTTGTVAADDGATYTTPLGTQHEVTTTHHEPGSQVGLTITAEDLSGNTDTHTESSDLDEDQTFYLHNRGDDNERFMNEFQQESASEGVGWNILGGLIATANHHTGTETLVVEDVWPVDSPTNPGVTLTGDAVDATIYLRTPSSVPNAGTVHEGGAGVVTLNFTLYANGDELIGYDTHEHVALLDEGWVPVEFEIDPAFVDIEPGTLRAELHAETATSGYIIGYEGDHASHIDVPIQQTLPLQGTLEAPSERVMTGDEVTFHADVNGGDGDLNYAWDFGDGTTATTQDPTATHTFTERGERTVTVTIDDGSSTFEASASVLVHQADFVDEARTVVAVLDTGINPYHPIYQRPGIDVPLDDFKDQTKEEPTSPPSISLADEGTYDQRVNSYRYDRDTWNAMEHEELVHFEGTNVLGISLDEGTTPPILDSANHGTATSSTVLDNHPDAIVVMVQISTLLSTNPDDHFEAITEGMEWAAQQDWIDVVSVSMGFNGNPPVNSHFHEHSKKAHEDGKIVVVSSGNDPNTNPTGATDGAPWVLSVSGSQADGQSKEVMSTNIYPDYVAPYTVQAAEPRTTEDSYSRIGGTSFSAPGVAGVAAASVHAVREEAAHTSGIEEGALVTGLDEGQRDVTNADVRAALNKTAILPEWSGYVAGINYNGDHAHPPGAPWLTAQWGHVDASIVDATAQALLDDDLDVPEDKETVAVYKGFTYQLRALYWNNAR